MSNTAKTSELTAATAAWVTTAAVIGNVLIWFDLAVFGFFAVQISHNFFPSDDPFGSMVLTLAAFSLSFVVRPLGSFVLGAYADRAGRRAALLLSILLIFFGTATIALIPPFGTIGYVGTVAVVCSRLIQGFAAGGEYGASTAYLAELSQTRRGLIASLQTASQSVSGMLAAAFGIALNATLDFDQLNSWGWRLPFVFGLFIAPIGLYLRAGMRDDSRPSPGPAVSPATALFSETPGHLLCAIGLLAIGTGVTYLLSYLPTYAAQHSPISATVIYTAIFTGFLIQAVAAPLMGHISDRSGRLPVLFVSAIVMALSFYPIFELLSGTPSPVAVIGAIAWLALWKSAYSGPLPALLADLYPHRFRATGVAASYNIGVAAFGGTAPLVMDGLGRALGTHHGPTLYLVGMAMISLIALAVLQRSKTSSVLV